MPSALEGRVEVLVANTATRDMQNVSEMSLPRHFPDELEAGR